MMKRNRQSKQSGATLLEVLVAIVVLSVGLLGMAGLQVAALRSNQTSLETSQAMILAYDVMDRMRANREEAIDGLYMQTTLGDALPGSGIAAVDMRQWWDQVKNALGSDAKYQICYANIDGSCSTRTTTPPNANSDPDIYMQVKIEWTGRALDASESSTANIKLDAVALGRI